MIHHHPPPTRGRAMKFIRRSDLEPQTRIDIVRLAWQGQGIYGKMTQLAQEYHISRTFLYQMTWAAHRQSATSGKAGGLKKVEPLKAVRVLAAYRRPLLPQVHLI